MVYENKLKFYKRPRPNWPSIVELLGLVDDYNSFVRHKRFKIKSKYKLSYIYLRRHFGIRWISYVRSRYTDFTPERFESFIRYDWTYHPEED